MGGETSGGYPGAGEEQGREFPRLIILLEAD